ncbi:uronyl 2-sulfotransferase-like isoform X2 [Ptychodera flava]|uniref:uronyl 2-sulfotransferase-like isoform X2 n=1 Tax=Ptychodera flava TaxID=63121 RepID=UPI003969CBA6
MASLYRYKRPAICSFVALCIIAVFAIMSSSGRLEKVSVIRPAKSHSSGTVKEEFSLADLFQTRDIDNDLDNSDGEYDEDDAPKAINKHLNPQSRIVYNRVGKCGSRTVLEILRNLVKRNGFDLYSSQINNVTHLSLIGQVELVNIISSLQPPFIYQRHFHFIDFPKFGAIEPVYINIIRDPVDRFISQYYFKRFGDGISNRRFYKGPPENLNMTINECVLSNDPECRSSKLFYIIPFFCGHDERCRTASRWSLEKAISNLEEKFLVVGFIEDLEASLQVLEILLPQMFEGAAEIYKLPAASKTARTSTKHKVAATEEVRNILKSRLPYEYEFYDFAKKKFEVIKGQLKIVSPKR